ncbi:AAA-like domain-containing protein [Nostoc sp. 'Peltigera malacea cyanobiont' DB3992]|uniref:AAA-like domain-containing protein n=1 Tax=Nostoc sp. 'Peltigera malacea cyanobiont' DB3992 TaxID=1206980 RepID=UPI003FA5C60A
MYVFPWISTAPPFNVGLPIRLPELTEHQVEYLAQRHGLDWTSSNEVAQPDVPCGGTSSTNSDCSVLSMLSRNHFRRSDRGGDR